MTDCLDEPAEIRFRVRGLNDILCVRRSASVPPAEGTICLVSWGTIYRAERQTGATYSGGQWTGPRGKAFKAPPTHYTIMEGLTDALGDKAR